jgi:hypothetical protein
VSLIPTSYPPYQEGGVVPWFLFLKNYKEIPNTERYPQVLQVGQTSLLVELVEKSTTSLLDR